MREIPKKNYLLLLLVIVGTVLVSLFLTRLYNNRHQETSTLYGFLSEVTLEDIDTYLIENETAVLYIDDKHNLSDNKEEKKLKKKIINYNLKNQFVFLDSTRIDQEFIGSFDKKYHYTFKEDYPMIVVIKNKKVVKTYDKLNVGKFNFEDLK